MLPSSTSPTSVIDKVQATCNTAAPSFFCDLQDETLTLITGKGVDYFFTPAGELAAAFAKQQRGQRFNNYALDNGINLVPFDSAIRPGVHGRRQYVTQPARRVSGAVTATACWWAATRLRTPRPQATTTWNGVFARAATHSM